MYVRILYVCTMVVDVQLKFLSDDVLICNWNLNDFNVINYLLS